MKAYLPEPARQRRLLIRTTGPQIILGKVRLLTSPGRGPSTGSDHCSFPVITGATGQERIDDGYPDVALEMIEHRTFDGRIQLVDYKPRVLEHRPLGAPS